MDAETIDAVLRLKDEWTPRLNAAFQQLDKFGAKAVQVGQELSMKLTLPLVGMGYAVISAGSDFESAMNKVEAAVQPPAKDMERLRAAAMEMGAQTVFSSTEAANALTELGKAGFSTQQAIDALPSTLELAVAGQMSMADAASLTANTMKTFKLSVQDLSHANDVLAKAANSSTIDVADLRETIKYVGPVAAATGMSLETVAASAALMGEAGIKGSMAGTALRGSLTALMSPTKRQAELMAELGLQGAYANGKLIPMSEIVAKLGSQAGKSAEIMELFGDRAGPGLLALVEKGAGALVDLEGKLKGADGQAKRAAETMMKGLPGALERMQGAIDTARVSLSKAFEPAIIAVADGVGKLADWITNSLVPAFQALPQPVQTGIGLLLGVAAAAGPVLIAIGSLSRALVVLTGSWGVAVASQFAGVLFTLGNTVPVLTARIWLMEAATKAWAAASALAAGTSVFATLGAGAIVVGSLTAVVMAGRQAWLWYSEAKERAAANARQLSVDEANLARISATAGIKFKDLNEALKWANTHAKELREANAALIPKFEETVTVTAKLPPVLGAVATGLDEVSDALDQAAWDKHVKGLMDEARALAALAITVPDVSAAFRDLAASRKMAWTAFNGEMVYDNLEVLKSRDLTNGYGTTGLAPVVGKAADATKVGVLDGIGTSLATALPQVIQAALTGGGDAFKASGSAVGSIVTSGIVSNLTKNGSKLVSGALGGMFASAMPVVGSLVGAALGNLVGKLFGPSKNAIATQKANQEIAQVQAELLKVHGTLANIQSLNTAGAELVAAWNSKGVEGQKHFNKLLADFNAMLKSQETIKKNLAETEDKLLAATEQRAALEEQLVVTADQAQAAMDRYGISIEGAGQKVQQLAMNATFTSMINDIETMERAGIDTGHMINGMAEEISKAVQQSLKFGTVVPENMRHYIDALFAAGLLVDEHGEKITDLTGIKFGPPIKSQFELVEDAISAIDETIQGLKDAIEEFTNQLRSMVPGAAQAAADGIEDAFNGVEVDPIHVPWRYDQQGESPGGLPSYADSSKGFRDFGKGTLAVLHGIEEVRRPGDPIGEGRQPAAPVQNIIMKVGERTIARASVRGIPRLVRLHGGR